MIMLHAGALDGTLMLWGEESQTGTVRAATSKAPAKGRTHPPQARPYPFQASSRKLAAAIGETAFHYKPTAARTRRVAAWLPTRKELPVPSSPLVAAPSKSRARPRLVPWTFSAYRLAAAEAIALLCLAMNQQILAPGVVVGADLAYWTTVLRLAGSLVARQQYLPGVALEGTKTRGQWEPWLAGKDADWLAQLGQRMPAVARALTEPVTHRPPVQPALAELRPIVNYLVDGLVRTTMSEPSLPGPGQRRAKPKFDSIHDAWLHSLQSRDRAAVTGKAAERAHLANQVLQWQRPLAVAANSPFRLCFRLEEPADIPATVPAGQAPDSDTWFVRFLLQPHDDPSLFLPADAVWQTPDRPNPAPDGRQADPRVFLLTLLGQASGVCPAIATCLTNPNPAGYALDTVQAHGFLCEEAMALEQAGYGVLLPAWWTGKGTKARPAVQAKVRSPQMQGGSGISMDTIIQIDWEVALGDQQLAVGELEMLAQLKVPLVKVRGQWVEMSAAEIQGAIALWKQREAQQATLRDIIRMAIGAGEAPPGFDFQGVKAQGWRQRLLEQLEGQAALEEPLPPSTFAGTLRPYQKRGFSWLHFLQHWGLGACLADDMGLGKTIQALVLILHDWQARHKRPVLLIGPTSVVNNWQKEAQRFTPELPVLVHHGSGRHREAQFTEEAQNYAIVISSYGLLQRDAAFLQEVPWRGIVLDEAQNIKNPETRQARAARTLTADYRIALTGTPIENNVGDLWSVMEFLNPGLLGTQSKFRRQFFVPIQAERDARAAARLQRITGPFILRRLKTDRAIIADLPEKLEMKVFCSLTREQASLYAAVLKDMEESLEAAEGIQRRGQILATLAKLKQVCNHPAQFLGDNSSLSDRSGKLARLTEMLEEVISTGDRALVFSQFAEMGHLLQRHVQETFGQEVLFLYGGIRKAQRDRMVERFQDPSGGPQVFILSLKAGGTGLNLTAASHVFHFDRWWNPAVENQATDRVFRIGQTRNVQVHKFLCAGTLKERIDEMIERKQEVADQVVGTGEQWLTELSNTDLKNILALNPKAVGG